MAEKKLSFNELHAILVDDLIKKRIQNKKGLNQFVENRAKFEGWFKVELIDFLVVNGYNAIPEIFRIDITISEEWAIELKTINTSYKLNQFKKLKNKTKPITMNIAGIINDIKNLKENKYIQFCKNNEKQIIYKNKVIIFIVFPVEHKDSNSYNKWIKHKMKIENELNINEKLTEIPFNFSNDIPALYVGYVK